MPLQCSNEHFFWLHLLMSHKDVWKMPLPIRSTQILNIPTTFLWLQNYMTKCIFNSLLQIFTFIVVEFRSIRLTSSPANPWYQTIVFDMRGCRDQTHILLVLVAVQTAKKKKTHTSCFFFHVSDESSKVLFLNELSL